MRHALTHEQFVQSVRDIVAAHCTDAGTRTKILAVKLTYGAAERTRGTTYFNQWHSNVRGGRVDFACISAWGQQSFVQLAGTTIHELAHVVAGREAGHGKDWFAACESLGLRCVKAAGTEYSWANFAPPIREAIFNLGEPTDGIPTFQRDPGDETGHAGAVAALGTYNLYKAIACSHGIGSRGGKSRGKGSGSRMRKYVCNCGQIIRAATDKLVALHGPCGAQFMLVDK
jgi:hypothetical protein